MADKYRFFHRAHVHASVAVAWSVFTDHERISELTNTRSASSSPAPPNATAWGAFAEWEFLTGRSMR